MPIITNVIRFLCNKVEEEKQLVAKRSLAYTSANIQTLYMYLRIRIHTEDTHTHTHAPRDGETKRRRPKLHALRRRFSFAIARLKEQTKEKEKKTKKKKIYMETRYSQLRTLKPRNCDAYTYVHIDISV